MDLFADQYATIVGAIALGGQKLAFCEGFQRTVTLTTLTLMTFTYENNVTNGYNTFKNGKK